MVSSHQFKKLLEVLLDFEQFMAAHSLIKSKVLTSLFEDMYTKYSFISTNSFKHFMFQYSPVLLHDNPQKHNLCAGLLQINLELLSLIPQGHKKNRYHCNFFLYGSLPLCLLPNKPY